MTPNPFKYTPLVHPGDIRLLELLPGTGRVQCRLLVANISKKSTPYEPLSYCWGKQTNQVTILVEGASFDISANLHLALKRLRLKSQVRTLWVDAICINQHEENSEEKSSQISLMKHIFQNGQRTVVWIGEHDSQTALAFQIIQVLSDYAKENPESTVYSVRWQEFRRIMLGKGPVPLYPMSRIWARWQRIKAVSALVSIFDRAWFRRVWVIQELAVSQHVLLVCGKHSIAWDEIELAYDASLDRWGMHNYLGMLLEQRRGYNLNESRDAASVILAAARSQATDPRDRIYGMLGLISRAEDNALGVEIDYTIESEDLFMDLTKRLFQETSDAGMLAACIGCQDVKTRSWALRYADTESCVSHAIHFAWQTPHRAHLRSATSDSTFECKFADNDTLFGVSGIVIDTIIASGPVMQPLPSTDILKDVPVSFWIELIRCYLSWRAVAGLNEQHDSRWDQRLDAFIQTIWYESVYLDENNHADEETRELFVKFDRLVVDNFSFLQMDDSSPSRPKSRQLTGSLHAVSVAAGLALKTLWGGDFSEVIELYFEMIWPDRRRLARTKKGRIGLVPAAALPGDEVVLVAGSIAPFIFRPIGTRYRLVGDACIHGVMDGEAWDEAQTVAMWLE